MSNAYQDTAPIKSQEIAASQAQAEAAGPNLHALARQASHRSVLTNAVNHLNKQVERGEHAPSYDPSDQAVS